MLLAFLGIPALLPLWQLVSHPKAWLAWREYDRLLSLSFESISLALGVIALAMPLGIVCALLLERTRLPLRGLFRFAVLLGLFIPLPLYASAWQGVFSASGVFTQLLLPPPASLTDFASLRSARPWSSGLLPAVLDPCFGRVALGDSSRRLGAALRRARVGRRRRFAYRRLRGSFFISHSRGWLPGWSPRRFGSGCSHSRKSRFQISRWCEPTRRRFTHKK